MEPDALVYRAVIVKRYPDETVTLIEGPYSKIGTARARVTFWKRHFAENKPGASAAGHVEVCRPQWARVPSP